MIRFFDLLFSIIAAIILSPLLLLIFILVKLTSKGTAVFVQKRVGKNNIDFNLYKFRTMNISSDVQRLLTVGEKDKRITKVGVFLRRFKLDELPQLINVIKGDMSLVGPRPEVRYFVNYYTTEQLKVLNVLPGITDYASIKYRNENELLEKAENPEAFYINHILPEKINLNLLFINNPSLKIYFQILWATFIRIIKK
ncbi:MAG: sugar transferase [Bacteroidetes bacterium]|nr:sugar transferase [Bacteroidota bacterium]MBS1591018.1 sugar transferase [Bacteroidota bacterium]